MSQTRIPEQFIALVQVLAEDEAMQRWFESLSVLPANRRYSELGRLSAQLRDASQEALSRTIMALNDEQIYQGIRSVMAAMK